MPQQYKLHWLKGITFATASVSSIVGTTALGGAKMVSILDVDIVWRRQAIRYLLSIQQTLLAPPFCLLLEPARNDLAQTTIYHDHPYPRDRARPTLRTIRERTLPRCLGFCLTQERGSLPQQQIFYHCSLETSCLQQTALSAAMDAFNPSGDHYRVFESPYPALVDAVSAEPLARRVQQCLNSHLYVPLLVNNNHQVLCLLDRRKGHMKVDTPLPSVDLAIAQVQLQRYASFIQLHATNNLLHASTKHPTTSMA